MVAHSLHLVPAASALPTPPVGRPRPDLAGILLAEGAGSAGDIVRALALVARQQTRLADVLLINNMVDEEALLAAQARQWRTEVVDPTRPLPDVRLVDAFGAARCLAEGLLPWRRAGGTTVIVSARPELFDRYHPELEALFGPVALCVASERAITAAIMAVRAEALGRLAETRVAPTESCRSWRMTPLRRAAAIGVPTLLILTLLAPATIFWALAIWAVVTLFLTITLKGAAAVATLRARRHPPPEPADAPAIARLPVVSIMVPLFRETDIAPRLVARLNRLDYPRELLDILLVVEEEDQRTREALAHSALPRWMRIVIVPPGTLKTKPRALNYALDFCRGAIIGIYDAEDAPDPDQIHKVVAHFHRRGPDVACLQGVLDYYNPRTNWIARCFTIEYAAWFRVVLPGLERLGLPVPLGGTTLFLRRNVIEELGRWDAHNVTEDADLGIRLARHGYRTEFVTSVTREEANCRPLPWVRQRSRWLKGFMITWAVHLREPRHLWRQLGPWRFFGVQLLFAGSLSQFLLAPLLWSSWLMALGIGHPFSGLPTWALLVMGWAFVATEAVNIAVGLIAISGPGHRFLMPWVPTLTFYFPLGTLAAYKAAWELLTCPFYWDKTSHGHFDTPPEQGAPATH